MNSFVHEGHPARVVFGAGARSRLGEECERLGISRAFVIGTPALVDEAKHALGARTAASTTDVVMHVPIERAVEARAAAKAARADAVVSLGGGSSVGLAKAIALEIKIPIVAVPTTYAGSEMTSIWGLTEAGVKRTGRDQSIRPRTVIYDPELTVTLPPRIAGPSGLNALAHAMEALYAPRASPIDLLMAEESVRSLAQNLPLVAPKSGELEASAGVLYGAWLAGICLDRTTMGIHHKLCHVLGGTFSLPHAEVHSVILPFAAAFNCSAAPGAMKSLARALGIANGSEVPSYLQDLARRVGAPLSLAAIGMKESDLDRAAALATENPYENPRPVDRASVRALLQNAFLGLHGETP